jgi:hypothetical protein
MSDNQEAVDLFAVRYAAADGAWQWQKRIASRGNTFAFGLGVDGHGDALVGGTFTTSVDLGLGPLETNGSVPAIFVGKLDGATGDAMWRRKIDDTAGAGFATLAGLVVDSHDDFVLAGGFGGRIDLAGDGPDGDLSTQTLDGYVAKLSGEDGGLVWQKQIGAGSTADGSVASVTLAPDDSVTLVAQYGVEGDTKVVFLGRELAGAGGSTEVVVGRLAGADGGLVWARRFGGPGSDQGNFVAALADGGVVVAGGCTASFSFDDHPVAFSGVQEDSFFAILDETGTATYATRVGSLDFDRAVGAAVVGRSLIGVGRVHDQGAFLGKTFDPPGGASGYAFQVTLP